MLSSRVFVRKCVWVQIDFVDCSRWNHNVMSRRRESKHQLQVMSQSQRWTRLKVQVQKLPKVLKQILCCQWGGGGQHFYVCLGLIWLCSVSIEQAEKNGDSSETKPDAAVSISSSLAGTLDFLFYLAYDVLFVPIFGYIISFPMNKPLDLIKQHYLLKCIQWVLFKWKCK